MPEENIYLEATELTPLISSNEDAFTLRSRSIAHVSRPKSFYIKAILVVIMLTVIIAITVNTTIYTEQVAEYKKVEKDKD